MTGLGIRDWGLERKCLTAYARRDRKTMWSCLPRNGRVRAGTLKLTTRQISQARLRPANRRALSSKLDARQFAVRTPSGFAERPDTKGRYAASRKITKMRLDLMSHSERTRGQKWYNMRLDETRKVLWKSGSVAQPSQSEHESSKGVRPSLEGKCHDKQNTDVRVLPDGHCSRSRRGLP